MKTKHQWLMQFAKLGVLLVMGGSMNAGAGLFGSGSTSWKEEVLLHDGSKIVVERWANRGGRHEIGQQPPIKEQNLSFTVPLTNERISWKSEFSADVGAADLEPLQLGIVKGLVYLVAVPVGCLSYNKWGRPNPPYIVFQYQDKAWKRITLQELPAEAKTPNLVISSPDNEIERTGRSSFTADDIRKINSSLRQPEYQSILREVQRPHADSQTSCPIPSNAAAKLIAPEVDGKLLHYNWWPLAQEWLAKTYGKTK